MRDSRTNSLLGRIMVFEEKLELRDRSNITLYFNGNTTEGIIISDDEYYNRQENNKYKEIYYECIKNPREPCIKRFQETGNLDEFPDNLRQVHLHILNSSGGSIQVRLADVVAFSFN